MSDYIVLVEALRDRLRDQAAGRFYSRHGSEIPVPAHYADALDAILRDARTFREDVVDARRWRMHLEVMADAETHSYLTEQMLQATPEQYEAAIDRALAPGQGGEMTDAELTQLERAARGAQLLNFPDDAAIIHKAVVRLRELRKALQELVTLKEIKTEMEIEWRRGFSADDPKQWTNERWHATARDYETRKPLAWDAARRALAPRQGAK